MKKFSCGDVVPGCQVEFTAEDDAGILAAVAAHARETHGMIDVPAEVVSAVRSSIVTL